jgi:hypothetical protein
MDIRSGKDCFSPATIVYKRLNNTGLNSLAIEEENKNTHRKTHC